MLPAATLNRNAGQTLVSVPPVTTEAEDVVFANGIDHLAGVFEERLPVIISMLAKPAEGKQVDTFFITEFPEQTRETPIASHTRSSRRPDAM